MPIPDIPDFEKLLSGIRLAPNTAPDGMNAARLPFLAAADETGEMRREAPLWLHYPTGPTITFERLLERIGKELNAASHHRQHEFSLFALALAMLAPSHHGTAVARINDVLDCVCDADVTLYFILWASLPEYYQYEIRPFNFGRLLALPASASAGLYTKLEVSHCHERQLVRPEKTRRVQEELARDLDPETLGIISIARDLVRLMRAA